jgi:hypothetical protein
MITFDNQLSTGIQAFGHCGSPTCSMTSAFGAYGWMNTNANATDTQTQTSPQTQTYTPEPNLIKGAVYIGLGFLFLELFILGGKVATSRLT